MSRVFLLSPANCGGVRAKQVLSPNARFALAEELRALEPFGAGNPRPVFMTRNLRIVSEPRVMKEKHLKLRIAGARGRPLEAVWWDGVERSQGQTLKPNSRIELAYVAEANVWQGNARLQLVVEDLRADN